MSRTTCRALALLGPLTLTAAASAGPIATWSMNIEDGSGLSGYAEFNLLDSLTLEVILQNTSTSLPSGIDNSGQILTGLSWDFGHPGFNGDTKITGGTILTGSDSVSLNFSVMNVGGDADVGGEWGFGNMDGTGALTNFISANTSLATPFGGINLDGPEEMDGPQGGLVANPILTDLGGLGAIQDTVVATLNLSDEIFDLDFLVENFVRLEFGSDAYFITTPAPGTLALLGLGALIGRRRRR